MALPHARFNVLFHNRPIYHSRSLNRDDTWHPSLETILEGGPDSALDREENINVDGRGLQLLDESEVDRVDCTVSGNDHFSNEQASPMTTASFVERRTSEPSEAGNFVIGEPRLLAEAHISQRQADNPYYSLACVIWDPFCVYTSIAGYPSTDYLSPLTVLPTYSESSPITTTASTPSRDSYSPFQSTSSPTERPTSSPSSASGDPPSISSGNAVVDTAYTTVASTSQIISITTTLLEPPSSIVTSSTVTSFTVTSTSIVMVSSLLPQPSSVSDTASKPILPQTIGAITGGIVGAVVLLALLTFIVLRHRRKNQFSVTPFNLPSTAGPTQVEGRKFQSASGAVRPSSRSSSFIQYSDGCLVEYSGNGSPSYATDQISSHFVDDEISGSSVARRYWSHRLEKLYPYLSHVPASDHHSVESCADHMVTDGRSQEQSEELPAYPRSLDSLRSETDHDDRYVLTSS
ncbi:uncharacterized protein EDB93DRAFT_1256424 [Suillus bovinus]|uniref:uncharacterized protein n=1 Tax=Suillus bovinus TaxID=48563 RepID=UPI001B87CD85|nr:uncharacterized protein EDB93DRAFT_1256424 [Suillus bovinus]KAG2129036.1 hypothetical protein EDB93DRAFT_1256424 [Suillus bovinus]